MSLNISARKAKSKDFTFLECPIAPQIDFADELGLFTIVSKTV